MYRNISFSGVYIWNKIQDHINVYCAGKFTTSPKKFLPPHQKTKNHPPPQKYLYFVLQGRFFFKSAKILHITK